MCPAGLLQPLLISSAIWEDIFMDFISSLPRLNGLNYIFVVTNRLYKYIHFMGLKHSFTAKFVTAIFSKKIVFLHNVSDRDLLFLNNFRQELFQLQGTNLQMSTTYRLDMDGQIEILNRYLETYLRCFSLKPSKQWSNWLHWVKFWFNTSFHTVTEMTPFEVVYGRHPLSISKFMLGESKVKDVEQELVD